MPSRSKSLSLLCWLALGAPVLYAGMALEVGKGGGALAFPHGNGRQIARSSSGLWFLAYDGQVDGAAAILLAGSRGAELGDLVVDRSGRLWVVYSRLVTIAPATSYRFLDGREEYSYKVGGTEGYEIWAATLAGGTWKRARLTAPGPYRFPVLDLDATG